MKYINILLQLPQISNISFLSLSLPGSRTSSPSPQPRQRKRINASSPVTLLCGYIFLSFERENLACTQDDKSCSESPSAWTTTFSNFVSIQSATDPRKSHHSGQPLIPIKSILKFWTTDRVPYPLNQCTAVSINIVNNIEWQIKSICFVFASPIITVSCCLCFRSLLCTSYIAPLRIYLTSYVTSVKQILVLSFRSSFILPSYNLTSYILQKPQAATVFASSPTVTVSRSLSFPSSAICKLHEIL